MSTKFERVIGIFKEICAIPHGSYNIDAISDYLADFAKSRGLKYKQDEFKNVIIFKPAAPGYENEPAVMLQGHMDMVAVCDFPNEKDMAKEGLEIVEEDGFIYAKNTSLGGDDGIALAYALAILEDDTILHPALEAVFTVNEEVGMEGASGVDFSGLKSKRLINIDSEEEGVITVACAGGIHVRASLNGETEKITAPCVFLSLNGLTGGHSGMEIHKGRANGAHLLAEVLLEISEEYDLHLISMAAGEKTNVIPASGSAEFLITDLGDRDEFIGFVEAVEDHFKKRYEATEEGFYLTVGIQLPQEETCFTAEASGNLLEYVVEVPDGVIKMCEDIDMVETSLNLGVLKCTTEGLSAEYLLRSNLASEKEALVKRVFAVGETYGGSSKTSEDYPAWEYLKESPFRDKAVSVYEKMYGEKPVVTGVHAGLECGILSGKTDGLEAISIGPDITDVHTTKERMDLKSAERVWEYILALLASKD